MQKIILDPLNTIDSVMWKHKDHTVLLSYLQTDGEKYLIYRPGEERSELSAPTLEDARQLIDSEAE